MKKFVAFILVITLIFTMSFNVFALTTLTTTTPMATIRIDGKVDADGNPVYYYYNAETGVISTDSTTTAEGLGDLIMPSKTNDAYAFTATTGDRVYHYQVLDEITVDGEKQYFIFCNDAYGYGLGITPLNNVFDPSVETNIAYWLNNTFYNGTALASEASVALDTTIKPYIQSHDWLVEANASAPEGYPTTDYSVNCKIALLSITEYAKYASKIGWGVYLSNGNLAGTSGAFHSYLRSPVELTTKNLRTLYSSNGCTASLDAVKENYGNGRIRPCFYVSEDYFKEVELTSCGTEVQKIVDSLDTGVKIITENAETIAELSEDEWNNAAQGSIVTKEMTEGDENQAISITAGKHIDAILKEPVNTGILTIEADYFADSAKLYMGLIYEGSTSPSYKYVLYMNSASDDYLRYLTTEGVSTTASYDRNDITSSDLRYNVGEWNKIKTTINFDTGYVYTQVNDDLCSMPTNNLNFIKTDNKVAMIAFWHNSGTGAYIDNLKITYDKNGSAIKEIKATGEKEITITAKDGISFANVTASDINVTNNTVSAIELNGQKLKVTLDKKLAEETTYFAIVDNIENSKVDDYISIGNFDSFTYTVVPFSTTINITDAKFSANETVKATFTATPGTTEDLDLQIILAAYSGKKLVAVSNPEDVDVLMSATSNVEKEVTLTLTNAADLIRAFVWDMNMVPVTMAEATPDLN